MRFDAEFYRQYYVDPRTGLRAGAGSTDALSAFDYLLRTPASAPAEPQAVAA